MFNQPRESIFPSWLLWVIGPVTVIAAALIIFAVVLGIRAGQRQIETQRRQEVGIALQRAVDMQNEGRLQDAVAEYRRALMLDPGNETALAGIQTIVDQATGGVVPTQPISATAPSTTTVSASATLPTPAAGVVIAPTATAPVSAATQTLFDQARTVYGTGQWQQAVTLLLELQQQAPDFQRTQVEEMLYNAYVNLAAAADQADDLELAIEYVDKALALRPSSSALQAARGIAANYIEALNQEGVDWGRAVELYEAVYVQDANYRQVRTRLNAARFAYGDQLALAKEWCKAEEQYTLALEVSVPAGSIARRDDFEVRCRQLQALLGGTPAPTSTRVAVAGTPTVTPTPLPTSSLATTVDTAGEGAATPDPLLTPESIEAAVVETPTVAPVSAGPVNGRLLYSALDPVTGGSNIYLQGVGAAQPEILAYGAAQPSFRPDSQRLVFRNLDNAMRGLTALDPATGLKIRFTTYSEDSFPSWNSLGNYIAFASNREGDRRWRLYVVWADVDNDARAVGYGHHPDWHPSEDRFAFQGCDDTGNGCGIRSMSGGGGDNRGITTVAADTQPDWAPSGQFLAFTSEARDGNPEIYRVDVGSGQVTRLTESGSIDASPAVSPDSAWVAFLSNRSGAWAVWAVPSSGGEAQQLFALPGNIGGWQEFKLQWVN